MTWSPKFIGIGAEKSATTWAWTMLDEHPAVCMSQPKELNYFNLDENYRRGDTWYRQHFSTDAECCGEISPLYMDDDRVAGRIRDTYPDGKILVILRNPFDRAMSHLFHDASVRYGTVAELTPEHMKSLVEKDDKYVRRSQYHAALTPFFETFASDQIGVFFFDDVKTDGLNLAQKIYGLAGVDANFVPEQFHRKVNESQDLRPMAGMIMKVSKLARSFPPSRMCMEWVYRRTRIREKVIQLLMVDKGRPKITFEQVFSKATAADLQADLVKLDALLPNGVPPEWLNSLSQNDLQTTTAKAA